MKQQAADESMRDTPEYAKSKLLLAKRKELQATLREINYALRTLQINASDSVNLAKADLRSEAAAQGIPPNAN